MPAGRIDATCSCGWSIPPPLLGQRWNAWDQWCMRREADGTYTLVCPSCGGPVIEGIVYADESLDVGGA